MKTKKQPILVDNKTWREKCPERGEMEKLFDLEADSLPRERGVVRDKKYVHWVNCPVCRSAKSRQLFVKKGFLYVVCRKCRHVYVRNQLREEYLEKLYVASAGDNKNLELQQNKHHLEYWNKMYEKYVSIVGEYEGNNRNILDVGCGIGSFLGFLKSARGGRHYSLHGLELNAAAADYVKKIVGEKCFYDKPLGTFALDKTFGSIYLWGVLEHLPNPLAVLKECRRIMADDGVLFFLVPNFDSLAVRILGVNTPTFNPRAHIQFFTDTSLQYMYGELGFKEAAVYFELPVIDLMYPYVDYSEELARQIIADGQGYYRIHILKKEL